MSKVSTHHVWAQTYIPAVLSSFWSRCGCPAPAGGRAPSAPREVRAISSGFACNDPPSWGIQSSIRDGSYLRRGRRISSPLTLDLVDKSKICNVAFYVSNRMQIWNIHLCDEHKCIVCFWVLSWYNNNFMVVWLRLGLIGSQIVFIQWNPKDHLPS